LHDVKFGLRLWRRDKIVAASAVLSLSLAIGALTAAFSLIDALILRPLPVSDPERLIYIAYRQPGETRDSLSFNYPLFEQLREASRTQVQLFGVSDQSRRDAVFDDAGGQPEKVYGQWISGDAFALLGVKPAWGRLLTASDDRKPGQHPVAVLSYDFWSRRFGRNPAVLGRWVTIREKQLQIVGVAEKGCIGVEPGIMTDIWAPNMMWDERAIGDSATRWFRVWGRLQPGVAPEQARAVLQAVFTNFRREQAIALFGAGPHDRIARFVDTTVYLRSAANGPSALREEFKRPLWTLASIAALVLLIACANVAGLLTARAAARSREMALRVSIGAGRARLMQQMLIESALLAIASCGLGALMAMTAAPEVVSMLSTSRSVVRLDVDPDWRLLAFLGAAGSIVTFLFGLAPALRASAVSPNDALKAGSGKHTARMSVFRPLVAVQTAFSFIVLFVAGMCLASFSRLANTDLGFDRDRLAIANVEAGDLRGANALAAWEELLERIREGPGVQSASLSGWALFQGSGRNKAVEIPGRARDAYLPWYLPVSPRFLETMGIRLIAGRDLEARDARPDTPAAVIVNESFARRYFPGEPALGRRFFRVDAGNTLVAQEIVGIAADAKYTSVREATPPTVYDALRPETSASVQVRTQLEPAALTALVRDAAASAHPAFRVTDVTLQSTLVDNTLTRDRALALVCAVFSVVAMVLTAAGLYGVLSYSVVQRTPEIGIRLALGARRLSVAGLLVSEVGVAIGLGLLAGAAGGLAASRFITALLYEVKPSDVSSVAAPLAWLLLACALSALIPALRATRIEPAAALRHE
jgi:predicted permease